ncbi:H/ACA ribonucleoprotein complex subunit dkc1 [Tritrichomonas musculus]|uniref:H/ACA ribonucleoprotein complex subunit dkc1 n=1 Tax=Tritrichomonas musculus TaxID=1915356 RepID=A0ABR2KSL6_9EUKA
MYSSSSEDEQIPEIKYGYISFDSDTDTPINQKSKINDYHLQNPLNNDTNWSVQRTTISKDQYSSSDDENSHFDRFAKRYSGSDSNKNDNLFFSSFSKENINTNNKKDSYFKSKLLTSTNQIINNTQNYDFSPLAKENCNINNNNDNFFKPTHSKYSNEEKNNYHPVEFFDNNNNNDKDIKPAPSRYSNKDENNFHTVEFFDNNNNNDKDIKPAHPRYSNEKKNNYHTVEFFGNNNNNDNIFKPAPSRYSNKDENNFHTVEFFDNNNNNDKDIKPAPSRYSNEEENIFFANKTLIANNNENNHIISYSLNNNNETLTNHHHINNNGDRINNNGDCIKNNRDSTNDSGSSINDVNDSIIKPVSCYKWPFLLENYQNLLSFKEQFSKYYTLNRPFHELVKYGIIIFDKLSNNSSYDIMEFIQKSLKIKKITHSGTLDSNMSGLLIIFIENATRIASLLQKADKEYLVIMRLFEAVDKSRIQKALNFLTGPIYQSPPQNSVSLNKQIRVREIYKNKLIKYDPDNKNVIIKIACEAGTYIRILCDHIGLILGVGSKVEEIRRRKIGLISEGDYIYGEKAMVTMNDIMNAKRKLDLNGDESLMRHVIRPLECLLTNYKRIILHDAGIDKTCYGTKVTSLDISKFDNDINVDDMVVIVSKRGEAVAIGIALLSSNDMLKFDRRYHAAKIKRVIMDRGTFNRDWQNCPVFREKKRLIDAGMLDENGRPNKKTPQNWLRDYLNKELNESSNIPNEKENQIKSVPFSRKRLIFG